MRCSALAVFSYRNQISGLNRLKVETITTKEAHQERKERRTRMERETERHDGNSPESKDSA